jgi:biotin transport system substrate-specific component
LFVAARSSIGCRQPKRETAALARLREGNFMNDNRRPTLVGVLWPERAAWRARLAALAVLGTLALVLSSKIEVPFEPVPMTLQTLAVMLLGAAYGARLAGATVALYLLEGLIGLPVFAGVSAGPLVFAGPTGGYLIGFLAAAVAIGFLAERGWDRSTLRLLAAMTIGHALIFLFGFAWLAAQVGMANAWAWGVAPFLAETLVKTLLAWALVAAFWRIAVALRKPA